MQRDAYEVYEVPNSDSYFDWRTIPIKDLDEELYLDKHTYFLTALQAINECRRRNELVGEFRRNPLPADKSAISQYMIDFKWKLYTNTDNSTPVDPETNTKSLIETINILKQDVKDWKAEADSFEKQLQSKQEQNEDLIQEISHLNAHVESLQKQLKWEHEKSEQQRPISPMKEFLVFYCHYYIQPCGKSDDTAGTRGNRIVRTPKFDYDSFVDLVKNDKDSYIEIISVTQLN